MPADANLRYSETISSTILPQWLLKFCRPSRMLWLAPLVGFMLSMPFLFSGYSADDHILRQQAIRNTAFFDRPAGDYFTWVATDAELDTYRERGIFVSWDTPDVYRWKMFRPLASMVHAFLFRFFDRSPWVMHLGLALLYALLIFLCAKLLTRFSLSPMALGLGILLFAVDDTHSYSAGWISSYNTILCCIFGYFALLMHDEWRRNKSTRGLLFFIGAFLLSLLSSEGGLALAGYLFAYALFLEEGSWQKKAASLIPGAAITLGYVIFYATQHFGVKGAEVCYLSPFDDVWHSAFVVLKCTIILVVSQIISIPASTSILLSSSNGFAVATILLLVVLFIFRKFFLSNKTIGFFGTGMLFAIVPFTLGMPTDRVLLWAGFGASGLMSELFTMPAASSGLVQRISARMLLISNIIISLICFAPAYLSYRYIETGGKNLERIVTDKNTILLNSADGGALAYAPAIRYVNGGVWPEHFYRLYVGWDTLTIRRTGVKTLTATTSGTGAGHSFTQGDVIDLHQMTATIEKATASGGWRSVRFDFKRDLSEFSWIKWTAKEPEKCTIPTMGEEMKLIATWP